jgi:hypothetical protein
VSAPFPRDGNGWRARLRAIHDLGVLVCRHAAVLLVELVAQRFLRVVGRLDHRHAG